MISLRRALETIPDRPPSSIVFFLSTHLRPHSPSPSCFLDVTGLHEAGSPGFAFQENTPSRLEYSPA
jgi:hypothetical protein